MTLLAAYDRARAALQEATQISEVLAIRAELDHVKLHARHIQDRVVLAEATVLQMRAERHLGRLLEAAEEAGLLAPRGRQKRVSDGDEMPPATLKEIGIERKLSARAKKAAALADAEFETIADGARDKIKGGKAILVDPIEQAAKSAEIDGRRAAHAARTLNGGRIEDLGKLALSGYRARFIGTDPQWKFLTRSAAGEGRSANIHYKTEEVDKIRNIPVGELAADDAMLGMWVVDWCPQDALDLIAHYGFKHVTTLYTWMKTNGGGPGLDIWSNSTWHMGQGYWTRANPEDCWLATRGNPNRLHADVRQLIIAPVMEHSRKPDEWLSRTERLCEGPYLELQARRTRPGWTSWGDELEWTGAAQ
jgi:N6-adenosine-specific RNA methylase IME4